MDKKQLKKHFEANLLDGDEIQERGQMLNASDVFDYIMALIETYNEQALELMVKDLNGFDFAAYIEEYGDGAIDEIVHSCAVKSMKYVLSQLSTQKKGDSES